MVYVINDFTQERLANLLNDIKRKKKKEILAKHYGSLIKGIDGMEYQKTVRSEWD